MGVVILVEESSLMYEVHQRLIGRAIEEWDKGGSGSFACFLLRFVHIYWVKKVRYN